ncbi:POK18 protein, partial [Pomatostomus ruficeps]|nr:POK18 protein [Pomatostomus ruficeps]
PMQRYHWGVLPQVMKNSPTTCQWYVAKILTPIRAAVGSKAVILHYMDDVLVCCPNDETLDRNLTMVISALEAQGMELQPDKIQKTSPCKYLGLKITDTTITPQKITIRDSPWTLQELHQLCGSLNWVRPWLGLTTEDLAPLFNLLGGGGDLTAPRSLMAEARRAIELASEAISNRQAHRYLPTLTFQLIILRKAPHFHTLSFQWDEVQRDSLVIIEWVFLPHQPSKTISTPQELMARLITREQLEYVLQTNENLQFALDSYPGQVSSHHPKHKLFNKTFHLLPKEVQSRKPLLDALTLFTDGSGKTHRSVITWRNPQTQKWESDVETVAGSPQVAELAAVIRAFERFPEPFSLVTDSAYVAGVTMRAEKALLKEVSNSKIFNLLSKLIYAISHREHPYFIMHVRSHTDLPGFIAKGNLKANALASPAELSRLLMVFEQAKISHAMFHQNVPAL